MPLESEPAKISGAALKIICIEEHTIDEPIDSAAREAVMAEASYMRDWKGWSDAEVKFTDGIRPRIVAPQVSSSLARDLGGGRLADMDKHGIDMQVLSFSSPPQLTPLSQAAELSRSANDTLARAIRKNPTRFGGFGCLPWQDPKAAVIETCRIANELGLKGVMIIGRPGTDFLDHDRYYPILAKLSELGLPLYVHRERSSNPT